VSSRRGAWTSESSFGQAGGQAGQAHTARRTREARLGQQIVLLFGTNRSPSMRPMMPSFAAACSETKYVLQPIYLQVDSYHTQIGYISVANLTYNAIRTDVYDVHTHQMCVNEQ
jgi:hypothetical protein